MSDEKPPTRMWDCDVVEAVARQQATTLAEMIAQDARSVQERLAALVTARKAWDEVIDREIKKARN